jgi:hypothetical protein
MTEEEITLDFVAGKFPHAAVLTGTDGITEVRVAPNRQVGFEMLREMLHERLKTAKPSSPYTLSSAKSRQAPYLNSGRSAAPGCPPGR